MLSGVTPVKQRRPAIHCEPYVGALDCVRPARSMDLYRLLTVLSARAADPRRVHERAHRGNDERKEAYKSGEISRVTDIPRRAPATG